MIEKFGTTLLFIFFVILLVLGVKMAIKTASPAIRKMSPSLADTLSSI